MLLLLLQKYITKGYVSEDEAGRRLAQVVSDPTLDKSGVYWSWDNDKSSLWCACVVVVVVGGKVVVVGGGKVVVVGGTTRRLASCARALPPPVSPPRPPARPPTHPSPSLCARFDTVDGALENRVSEEVLDDAKGAKLWDLSMKLVGLE